jgi:hypothetical protein
MKAHERSALGTPYHLARLAYLSAPRLRRLRIDVPSYPAVVNVGLGSAETVDPEVWDGSYKPRDTSQPYAEAVTKDGALLLGAAALHYLYSTPYLYNPAYARPGNDYFTEQQ